MSRDDYVRISSSLHRLDELPALNDLYTGPRTCEIRIYSGSRFIDPEPDELCGEPCDPGQDMCPAHQEEFG